MDHHGNKESSFYHCLKTDNSDQASILLSSGFSVNSILSDGKTPLTIAVERENFKMVELLLLHGADVNTACYSNLYCTFETALVAAARVQNLQILDLLLQYGEMKDETESRVGKTALQWAATYGDVDMAGLLLAHGADINWVGPYFHTALHYAATADQSHMVEFLLERGAELTMNGDGRTAIHAAAVRGNLPMLQHFICRRYDVNQRDHFNYSPFTLACLRGHMTVLEYLMDHSSTKPDLEDGLHKAAESGHIAVMRFLIKHGADVNFRLDCGVTPLLIAARGQYQAVELLLLNRANYRAVDRQGCTALQCALWREQYDIAKILIVHGADLNELPSREQCALRNQNNEDLPLSPLQLAFACSDLSVAKWIVQSGCCLTKEPWLTSEAVGQKLENLQENNNTCQRPMRSLPNFQKQKNICDWFINKLRTPTSLVDLCRSAIRCHMAKLSDGTSILPTIPCLPLPPSLQKFLALNELHHSAVIEQ